VAIKAYVLLKVSSGTEREVCKKISDFDEVLDASIVYGEYDIVVRVDLDKLDSLESFIFEKIKSVPSVVLTDTMIVAREYKGITKRNALKANNF